MSIVRWGLPMLVLSACSSTQEFMQGGGLEVDDPSRLGVHLIPGHGLDHDALEAIVEREFAMAGMEMTDLDDPRRGEVLYIWLGEARLESEEREAWSTYELSNLRIELWRPVRYRKGDAAFVAPAMTSVVKGSGGGGYAPGGSLTMAVCDTVTSGLRTFLSGFLKANGKPYTQPDDRPSACDPSDP